MLLFVFFLLRARETRGFSLRQTHFVPAVPGFAWALYYLVMFCLDIVLSCLVLSCLLLDEVHTAGLRVWKETRVIRISVPQGVGGDCEFRPLPT